MDGRHAIVTRFSVPRLDAATASRHADRAWLDRRLELFRRYFAPSVGRLGVPAVLLCSGASAGYVGERLADLEWLRVEVQDDWYGGFRDAERTLTRLDSDDALHEGWFGALDGAFGDADVVCTRSFLRLDERSGRVHAYRRREPSPLAAFRPGLNPFATDHARLESSFRVRELPDAYLLQVVHGGNLSSRRPRWWRRHRTVPRQVLRRFGLVPS